MTRPENDESVIEQARAWLLRSRRWAQRGLDRLANTEEVLTDRESVADFAEALQAIVDVTEPAQVCDLANTAQLLALIDLAAKGSLTLTLTLPRAKNGRDFFWRFTRHSHMRPVVGCRML